MAILLGAQGASADSRRNSLFSKTGSGRSDRRSSVGSEREKSLAQELMKYKLEADRDREAAKDVLHGLRTVVTNVKAGNLPEDFDLALELVDEINNSLVKSEPLARRLFWPSA